MDELRKTIILSAELLLIMLVTLCSALATDLRPHSNVDLQGYWNLTNASYVCIGSDCRNVWPTGGTGGGNASFNQTLTDSLYLNKTDQRYNDTTFCSALVSSVGNWTLDKTSYYTAMQSNAKYLQNQTCSAGYLMQNGTTSGAQCIAITTFYNASWNQTATDNLYYPKTTNPLAFYNSTTLPAYPTADNTSWNQSFANTKYIQSNGTLTNAQWCLWNSNKLDCTVAPVTQYTDALAATAVQNTSIIRNGTNTNFVTTLITTGNISTLNVGTTNLTCSQISGCGSGGNASFNQTLTDSLYYPKATNPLGYYNVSTLPGGSGDNASWNQSGADLRYYPLSTNPLSYYNSTTFTNYYPLTTNPLSYYNTSTLPAYPTGDNTSWNQTYANTKYLQSNGTLTNAQWCLWNSNKLDCTVTPVTQYTDALAGSAAATALQNATILRNGSDANFVTLNVTTKLNVVSTNLTTDQIVAGANASRQYDNASVNLTLIRSVALLNNGTLTNAQWCLWNSNKLDCTVAPVTQYTDALALASAVAGMQNTTILRNYTNANFTHLIVTDMTAASCDVKSTTNGTFYCGIDQTGGAGGNPFNQSLNTTENVQFANVNVTSNITVGSYINLVAGGGIIGSGGVPTVNGTSINVTTLNVGDKLFANNTNIWYNYPNPDYFVVLNSSTTTSEGMNLIGNNDSYFELNIENTNTLGSSDFIATSDSGSETSGYVDMGINNNGWSSGTFNVVNANDGYLYTQNGSMGIGTSSANKQLILFTGGTLNSNIRVNISDNKAVFNKNTWAYGGVETMYSTRYFNDFLVAWVTATSAYPMFNTVSIGTGGTGVQDSTMVTANRPGIWNITRGTGANSGLYIETNPDAFNLLGNESFETGIGAFQLLPGTNTSITRAGFVDVITAAAPVDGVYWQIITNSTHVTGNCINAVNSVYTTTGTANFSLPAGATNWFELDIGINATGTGTNCTIYNATSGAQLWSGLIASTVPTGAGRNTGAGVYAYAPTAGIVSPMFSLDYVNIEIEAKRRVLV